MGTRPRRRLGVYSLGFLRQPKLRRALLQAGWAVVPGPITRDFDAVGVWGAKPVSSRGRRAAARRNLPLVHIEDAPLRSVTAGPDEPLIGLTIDETGNFLDASRPSDLENLLNQPVAKASPDTANLLAEYLASGLSKYNDAFRCPSELPESGFVLVVDQVRDDASITLGGATASTFEAMLQAAIAENPDAQIFVKRHPRAALSHFADLPPGVRFLEEGFAICDVLDRASAVYCVTSQVGFEAILRGHRPRVFAGAFYAGWGLSEDEVALPRRRSVHSAQTLFERVMVSYPVWFDAHSGKTVDLATAMRGLVARRRAYELSTVPKVAVGIRLWKRGFIGEFLGPTRFMNDSQKAAQTAKDSGEAIVVWGSTQCPAPTPDTKVSRLEDGFLRSVGLGAELTEPLSLCLDDLGIYYDPSRESRLERHVIARADLPDWAYQRARALIDTLTQKGISKYNVGQGQINVPAGKRAILVPGQVEDDASIQLGTTDISTNLELLKLVRRENPDAHIIYKPHPDVEAGLRPGIIPAEQMSVLCDQIAQNTSADAALSVADEVWTMTSLMGFEALLRQKRVVCLGQPFYAGWGLTDDKGGKPARRDRSVSIEALTYAALIDYPLYRDPLTGLACPVETIVARLSEGNIPHRPANRLLSKAQGVFASQSWLWR